MTGFEMHRLASRLYPICRSITGEGLGKTLSILQEYIPLEIHAVPSGTPVFDWKVPLEWNVQNAWLGDRRGNRVLDFKDNNLHLLQYSEPFSGWVKRTELEKHLFSLPDQPTLIPYKTSYYRKDWGFCLSEIQRATLLDEDYEVHIETHFTNGVLNFGELLVPGQTEEEILISTHICHPSLANDNLSGMLVALQTALHFLANPTYYSIRLLFVPGTIGAISWLATNGEKLPSVKHGLVITGLGAGDEFNYKKSRLENACVDLVVEMTLRENGHAFHILPFSPYGYDERQYNSPGIALPVGCLMRTPHGTYPEYHTSADNLSFLKADALEKSADLVKHILENLSKNRVYLNLFPYGEPQLGKRGLYASDPSENLAFLWVLNLSDGKHSLLDISSRSQLSFEIICSAALRLVDSGLLRCIG
jgi:aminopeptidase-like protein